jgi:hypothetical protein
MYPGHSGAFYAPLGLARLPLELVKEFGRALVEGPEGLRQYVLLLLQLSGTVGLCVLQEIGRRFGR